VVPFDPGLQLIGGVVTLDEEETFDVQIKGHFEISTTDSLAAPIGFLLLQWGIYKAQFNSVVGGFTVPPIGTALGIADVNWKFHKHKFVDYPQGPLTAPYHIHLPVQATQRIGQGIALFVALQANWQGTGVVSYISFLEYRILRNVD
jgi:hypothetical protein